MSNGTVALLAAVVCAACAWSSMRELKFMREDQSARPAGKLRSALVNVKLLGTVLLGIFAAAMMWNSLSAMLG